MAAEPGVEAFIYAGEPIVHGSEPSRLYLELETSTARASVFVSEDHSKV